MFRAEENHLLLQISSSSQDLEEYSKIREIFWFLFLILRGSLLRQPITTPRLRKYIPRLIVFLYILTLFNALITPIWINSLIGNEYPIGLLPIQLFAVLTPMSAYWFLSMKYFNKEENMMKVLASISSEERHKVKKKLFFFCTLFVIIVVILSGLMSALMYEFYTIMRSLDFSSSSTPVLAGVISSLAVWILFFILTIFIGNAAVTAQIFLIIWICAVWIKQAENLFKIAENSKATVNEVILEHYRLRTGLLQACKSIQMGVGMILALTMLNFVLHIYTFLSFTTEDLSNSWYRWMMGFSAAQNLMYLFLMVIGAQGASRVTLMFERFGSHANDMATKYFIDKPEEFAKYQLFIVSVTCDPGNKAGYRVFNLLITNTTFISFLFSLLSFLLVIIERLLQIK